jgi:hypothetical protein
MPLGRPDYMAAKNGLRPSYITTAGSKRLADLTAEPYPPCKESYIMSTGYIGINSESEQCSEKGGRHVREAQIKADGRESVMK